MLVSDSSRIESFSAEARSSFHTIEGDVFWQYQEKQGGINEEDFVLEGPYREAISRTAVLCIPCSLNRNLAVLKRTASGIVYYTSLSIGFFIQSSLDFLEPSPESSDCLEPVN
jgi:hypothetical protein